MSVTAVEMCQQWLLLATQCSTDTDCWWQINMFQCVRPHYEKLNGGKSVTNVVEFVCLLD